MKKYGFFGGSFNPPTFAHLEIAKKALSEINLDKVFFVPVGDNYKKPNLLDENKRYEMLKMMCEDEKNLQVENIELNKKKGLSTFEALDNIEEKYNASQNYYIMGADNFIKLPYWENSEQMLERYNFIVFTRGNIDVEKEMENDKLLRKYKEHIKVLTLEENKNCSSGIIRDLLKEQKYEEAKKYTKERIIEYLRNEKQKNTCKKYRKHI